MVSTFRLWYVVYSEGEYRIYIKEEDSEGRLIRVYRKRVKTDRELSRKELNELIKKVIDELCSTRQE